MYWVFCFETGPSHPKLHLILSAALLKYNVVFAGILGLEGAFFMKGLMHCYGIGLILWE